MSLEDDFFLTNLELRESGPDGEVASGLSHATMKGMVLLTVLELAARGVPKGAVTVIHDAGDTGERYKAIASDLAERGWAVALPDMRGHGRTEGERGHSNGLREVVRDVQEIQDHLAYRMPHEPKILVGIGLGANYAAAYAMENPGVLSGVVLISPLHEPRFERPEAPRGLSKFFKKILPTSEGRTGYGPDALTAAPAQATAWSASELTHDVITLRAIEEAERSAREHLARIDGAALPVLAVHGDADPISDVAGTRALEARGVEVRIVEGGMHHLLHDRKSAETRGAITAWIDERCGG
ncbi:MAG: alpha/beta fold hydrolase [Planctomycetota bacterium]|nr:alpha/beta fold hydrolase [Planctomycetota bacterium]MEC8493383.1 alpha/beta fold hydrolase [Planctomycetota bacterium]MEC8511802.1 alpha/beta fold hydrolase [Planctomycetota bacterium]